MGEEHSNVDGVNFSVVSGSVHDGNSYSESESESESESDSDLEYNSDGASSKSGTSDSSSHSGRIRHRNRNGSVREIGFEVVSSNGADHSLDSDDHSSESNSSDEESGSQYSANIMDFDPSGARVTSGSEVESSDIYDSQEEFSSSGRED